MTSRLRVLLLALLLLAIASGLTSTAGRSRARLRGTAGLAATLYQGTEFAGPPVSQYTTGAVDLSILGEHPDFPPHFFSLRFSGTWIAPAPGPVQIFAGADDSVRVFIDGNLVIERNASLGFDTRVAATTLSAGPHQILVEYVLYGGRASLEMLWAPAG